IPRAFRFTTAGVFEFLAPLPNELQSQGTAVSADGTVIVGVSYDTTTFLGRAFRWKAGVEQDLGNLGGGQASATATSSDGSVVVGTSNVGNCNTGCTHAFRWSAATGMQDLGDLGGGSLGQGVSADGSVVVGSAPAGPPGGLTRAFRWTAQNGFEDLNRIVNGGGCLLLSRKAIPAGGSVSGGQAENLTSGAFSACGLVPPPPICASVTCASLGKNCGTISDGCGHTLTCGSCTAPQSCGGGGVANVCGPCPPTTCAAQGKKFGA